MLKRLNNNWHVRNIARYNQNNKVAKYLLDDGNPELVLADNRIKAVNRKRQDLSSRRNSEDPCTRQKFEGARKKHRNKNEEFFRENRNNIGRIKVAKNLLQQRINPPESAYNIPHFGDQEPCLYRHIAPFKIAHQFSYIHLETKHTMSIKAKK